MNCSTCGSPMAEGSRFCPSCGAQQPVSTSAGQTQTAQRPPFAPPPLDSGSVPQLGTPVRPIRGPSKPNTKAIISLAAGIAAWALLPFISGIVAIVFGHLAKAELRSSPDPKSEGDGFATVGLILGYSNVALSCFALMILLGVGATLLSAFGQ